MGQSNVSLSALIGSRICHDLISPIGAINNGLELLDMSGGAPGPEASLTTAHGMRAGMCLDMCSEADGRGEP